MENSNDEDQLHASTSLPQGSEEQGSNLLTNDSANIDRVHGNVPGISQSHNREIAPSGGYLMTTSSQINRSLLNRPNSGILSPHAVPFNPISRSTVGNIDQPPLDFNSVVPMFGPNQGAVSLNSPEMLEGRHLTSNSGRNTNVGVNTSLFGINLAGESNRGYVPPFSAHHSRMVSGRPPNPYFDVSGAISGFQNNSGVIYDLPQNADAWMHYTGNHYPRPGVRLGPPSLPSDSNQIMQSGHTVFSSPGIVGNQPMSEQLPEFLVNSNLNLSLQSSASLLGSATGRTREIDPSNQVRPSGMQNITSQATRPHGRSSHKRGASESQSSLAQARQRRSPLNNPPFPPSVPTWTGSAPLMHNTTQTIFPSSREVMPPSSQATVSTVRPPISTRGRTASSAPSTSQTIPPSICAATARPSRPQITSPPRPSRLRLTSPPRPRWSPSQSLPSTPENAPSSFTEGLDETSGLLGYKCGLCNRDLNLTPGMDQPLSRPSLAPVHAVLPCGHTFHDECLQNITPEDKKHDPPCIPCALGE